MTSVLQVTVFSPLGVRWSWSGSNKMDLCQTVTLEYEHLVNYEVQLWLMFVITVYKDEIFKQILGFWTFKKIIFANVQKCLKCDESGKVLHHFASRAAYNIV